MGLYTEIGVVNRRGASPDAIINEIRAAATARHTLLLTDPPTDAGAKPEPIFGGVGWDWRTLLRNRPLDVWMHEQDIRRAVDRPGGLDSVAARHTADYLAESLGYVVAKKIGAEPGTTVVLEMEGSDPFAFTVNNARRGRAAGPAHRPTRRRHCAWTARRSSGWPAGAARPSPARSASTATRTSAADSSTAWPPPRDRRRRPLDSSPTSPTRPGGRSW